MAFCKGDAEVQDQSSIANQDLFYQMSYRLQQSRMNIG